MQTVRVQDSESRLRYRVVIEPSSTGFSAYAPDLPGCVATGHGLAEVARNIESAIDLHLAGMREDGEPIPAPTTGALQPV